MFEEKGAVPSNMDKMCFQWSEYFYFEPLLWLGFTYQMVELCYNVFSSLWDISLLWRLRYHLILEYFVKLQHVTLSCSLPHATWILYNLSWRTCQNIMKIGLHLITINFSASLNELWVEIFFSLLSWWAGHGGPLYVCFFWIDFQNVSALCCLYYLLQLVTMVSRMHSEVWRRCKNKRFPTA